MKEFSFHSEQLVHAPPETVFDFFSRAENLEKLTPAFLKFQILTPLPIVMKTGALIEYKLKIHGLPMRWKTLIEDWQPAHHFSDRQLKGPYSLWLHRHSFERRGQSTLMKDDIRYGLPFGVLGQLVHPFLVRPDVEKIFAYRRKVIDEVFPSP